MSQQPGPPNVPLPGSAKAWVGTMAIPFAKAVAVLVTGITTVYFGHDLGTTIDAAIDTVVTMPIVGAAIYFTPHSLGGNSP